VINDNDADEILAEIKTTEDALAVIKAALDGSRHAMKLLEKAWPMSKEAAYGDGNI